MPTLTKLISVQEAAQHNTSEDCWIIVDGKVYDVTSYLDEHPGGDEVLLNSTGKDATQEFEDAGHSKSAIEQMEEYFIGELDPSPSDIPEQEAVDLKQRFMDTATQYWAIPVAGVGISVLAVGLFYLRKK